MKFTGTHLTEAARSVHQLKVEGISLAAANAGLKFLPPRPKEGYKPSVQYACKVEGYKWEIRFYPDYNEVWVALDLVFHGEAGADAVTATLSCRLMDPTRSLAPSEEKTLFVPKSFQRAGDCTPPFLFSGGFFLGINNVEASGYVKSDSLTVECTITVFKDLNEAMTPPPPSDLHRHLGRLLGSKAGSDVTFIVDGKAFAAHKIVLAARSPVFMAEFFGHMEERTSPQVEIKEMEPAVFKAMLHFIYTDMVPELDEKGEAAMAMAEHLLGAAERYALDRLKVLCERRLALGIDVSRAAATLALADQYGYSQLKAKCVEFIALGSTENLEAVLATEGYKILATRNPCAVTELLRAAHGRNK
ncbi:hypothetical protein ACP4OV_028065 [Aristida adscensionis]